MVCHRPSLRELHEHAVQDRLDGREHVLLGDEAHLHVKLIEFQRAIGPGVLIPEARRDLEVAVEAGHHQKLLELLGGLGEGVELAGVETRRDQKVTRSLGAGGGEDRGLEFREPLIDHPPADGVDHLRPQDDVAVQGLAAQV